jgi:hypothetical protein
MALDIRATLRIFSKSHTLSELTNLMGEPAKGFSIGDKFSKGKKSREHSYWSFDSSNIAPKSSFDDHLAEVLGFYEIKKGEILKLRDEGCAVNIFCLFSSDNGQGGTSLPSKTMGKLNELNLDLVFDVYADEE